MISIVIIIKRPYLHTTLRPLLEVSIPETVGALMIIVYLLVADLGSARVRESGRIPPLRAAAGSEKKSSVFVIPKQLGFDDKGIEIGDPRVNGRWSAVVFVFVSVSCNHCHGLIEDLGAFSVGYKSRLAFFVMDSEDRLPGGYSALGEMRVVFGWRKYFTGVVIDGVPAAIVFDTSSGNAIGPPVYGADKIRILLALTLNAIRRDSAE